MIETVQQSPQNQAEFHALWNQLENAASAKSAQARQTVFPSPCTNKFNIVYSS
jgi:hypothetical protein